MICLIKYALCWSGSVDYSLVDFSAAVAFSVAVALSNLILIDNIAVNLSKYLSI